MQNLQKLSGQIENVLANYPETRNSDSLLVSVLWREFYQETVGEIVRESKASGADFYSMIGTLLQNLPNGETVKRARAKIQNELKLYPPTSEKVRKERQKNIKKVRRELGYPDKELVHEAIVETARLDKAFQEKLI